LQRPPTRPTDRCGGRAKDHGPAGRALGTTAEAAGAWLVEGLRRTGVLVRLQESRRTYWLPGVGVFLLIANRRPGGPPVIGGPVRLMPQPEIRVKPQARTRGLPRLNLPGAAPAASETAIQAPASTAS
jgi:hypothetical protein